MRVCLIFNPTAGTADRIKDFLIQLTPDDRCELRPTGPNGVVSQIAREAIEEGADRIIVAGGDGTLHHVVNGIAPNFDAIELAVLPLGTGNDLARSLGILADQLDAACRSALCSKIELIDVLRVTSGDDEFWCVNVANGGLGGRVAADVKTDDKRRWGPLAYWMTSISQLVDLPAFHVELTLDGETKEFDAYGVAVANGQFVGGGFPIAPRAQLNDGLLDVTAVPVLPTFELMAAGVNFVLGYDNRDDRVRHFQARKIRIQSHPDMPFSVDGESIRRFDATFEVVPKVLQMATGTDPVGLKPAGEPHPFVT